VATLNNIKHVQEDAMKFRDIIIGVVLSAKKKQTIRKFKEVVKK
jgi:hypothetical protein